MQAANKTRKSETRPQIENLNRHSARHRQHINQEDAEDDTKDKDMHREGKYQRSQINPQNHLEAHP